MAWYWKEIDDKDSAEDATKAAVGVSYFVAGITGLLAILSIFQRRPVFGVAPSALLDAILFTVVGWRIGKLSRAWTVVGFILYIVEAIFAIARGGVGVLTIVFILAYINAVRGVFAYHRYSEDARVDAVVQ